MRITYVITDYLNLSKGDGIVINYKSLPNAKIINESTFAWTSKDLQLVVNIVKENNWIILGGDVITFQGVYTYDSWHYSPKANVSLTENVSLSVKQCVDYIRRFEAATGKEYLYSLVISNAFVGTESTDTPQL